DPPQRDRRVLGDGTLEQTAQDRDRLLRAERAERDNHPSVGRRIDTETVEQLQFGAPPLLDRHRIEQLDARGLVAGTCARIIEVVPEAEVRRRSARHWRQCGAVSVVAWLPRRSSSPCTRSASSTRPTR